MSGVSSLGVTRSKACFWSGERHRSNLSCTPPLLVPVRAHLPQTPVPQAVGGMACLEHVGQASAVPLGQHALQAHATRVLLQVCHFFRVFWQDNFSATTPQVECQVPRGLQKITSHCPYYKQRRCLVSPPSSYTCPVGDCSCTQNAALHRLSQFCSPPGCTTSAAHLELKTVHLQDQVRLAPPVRLVHLQLISPSPLVVPSHSRECSTGTTQLSVHFP